MKVVISFPLAYSDADLEGLINTAADIEITVCPYEEPGGVRSARTRGDYTLGRTIGR
jgi:hypothetical protein